MPKHRSHNKHTNWTHRVVKHGARIAQAYAYGRGQSHTQTSTKKEERIHGDDIHSGITSTGYKIIVNPKVPKAVDRAIAFQYSEMYNKVYGDPSGVQLVRSLAYFGTTHQSIIDGALTVDIATNPNLSNTSYLSLNPNSANTGSTLYGSFTRPSTTKVFLANSSLIMRVVNLATIACEVDVYVLKNKQNLNWSAEELWDECAKAHALGKSNAGFSTTGNVDSATTIGYLNSDYVDSTPFYFPDFKKSYQLLKVHHINMAAGASEKIHYSITNNQMIDTAKILELNRNMTISAPSTWTAANTSTQYPKGGVQFMLVAKGQLVLDKTGAAENKCATGFTKIGVSITKHHSFKTVNMSVQTLNPAVAVYKMNTGQNSGSANLLNINFNDAVVAPLAV